MHISRNTKQALILTIILTIVAIVFYVWIFNNIKNTNKAISTISNEMNLATKKEMTLRSTKSLVKDTEANRAKIENYFVADDTIVNFIETVESMSDYTGAEVKVLSVNVSDNQIMKNDVSEVLRLNLETKGTWNKVFHFLSLMEKMPFSIDILKADFEVSKDDTKKTGKNNIREWTMFVDIAVIKSKQL